MTLMTGNPWWAEEFTVWLSQRPSPWGMTHSPDLPSLQLESFTNYRWSPKHTLPILHPQQSTSFFSRIAGVCLLMASLELIQDRKWMANLMPSPEDHFWSCSNINNCQLLHFPKSFSPSPKDTVWQKMHLLQFLCARLLESIMRWEKMEIRIKLWIKK